MYACGQAQYDGMSALTCACLKLDASADIAANATRIRQGIQAAQGHCDCLLTPECALCGYPGAARPDLADLDLTELRAAEEDLQAAAAAAGLLLILGTVGAFAGGLANEALCSGATDHPTRYRKQCLTPADRDHFVAGTQPCILTHAGWRLGISICFDIRFADVYAAQAAAGAEAFLSIAHMAGTDPDPGCKARVLPAHYASRAAEWAAPLVLCNSTAHDRWIDSAAWDGRGLPLDLDHTSKLAAVRLEDPSALGSWYQAIRHLGLTRLPGD